MVKPLKCEPKHIYRVCWRFPDDKYNSSTLVAGYNLNDAVNCLRTHGLFFDNTKWHKDMFFYGEDNVSKEELEEFLKPKPTNYGGLFPNKRIINLPMDGIPFVTLALEQERKEQNGDCEAKNGRV